MPIVNKFNDSSSSYYKKLVTSYKFFNVMDKGYNNPLFETDVYKSAIFQHSLNSKDLIKNFINSVNKESKSSKTIVFIAGKCYPMMARQALLFA